MAKTKLTQLEVNEVSLVDAGANQHAHVTLYKNRTGEPGGDSSTQQAEKPQSGLRKLFSAIGKALAVPDTDIEDAVSSIEKADTFGQKMEQRKLSRITDEIWDVCYALESSLCSIIRDDEVTDKAGLMNQSIDEFTTTIKALTASWGTGTPAQIAKAADAIPVEHMQDTVQRLEEMLSKSTGTAATQKADDDDPEGKEGTPGTGTPAETGETEKGCTTKKAKGGTPDMRFNEDSMTPAERMAFEDLKKRYAVEDEATPAAEGTEQVGKAAGAEGAAAQPAQTEQPAPTVETGEDIYKGLHPAVKAEIDALKKRAAEADHKEMLAVAKKYQILGKEPEELAKTLEGLKAAGGTAYDDMIATMDTALGMVNTSGVFGEIGKRGATGSNGADAVTKIQKHAEDLQKADPTLSHATAVDKAWSMHPELVEEYENSRR